MNRFRQLLFIILTFVLVILFARRIANRAQDDPDVPAPVPAERPVRSTPPPARPPATTPAAPTPMDEAVPVAPPAAARPARAAAPEDALPRERTLVFATDEDMQQFIAMLRANGSAEILGTQDKLHALRIRIRDAAAYDAARPGMPQPQGSSLNFYTRIPPGTDRAPAGGPSVPYTDNVNRLLGLPPEHADWGNGLTVAVLDTGIGNHPMLAGANITRINLLPGDATPAGGTHGTAVGSLIAGQSDTVDGIAPAAQLLSVRVLDDQSPGDSFTLASGIVAAVDAGARILNVSLASSGDSAAVAAAVQYAAEHGVLIVAAAGNDGASALSYPARYPGVVSVGAVDATGRHVDFSNTGTGLSLAAPGVGVPAAATSAEGPGLALYSGTSVAAPIVSGLLARLLAADRALKPADAVALLTTYADDAGAPGVDPVYGAGVVNAARVEQRDTPGIYDIGICDFWHTVTPETIVVSVYVQNRGTEAISRADMEVVAAGLPYSINFYSLPPNTTATREITLYRRQITPDRPIDVTCRLSLQGQTDARPGDNEARITFFAVQP